MNTLTQTNFNFPDQVSKYSGKVREVYKFKNDVLVMISTDRLSAFDVVLPKGIPYALLPSKSMACWFTITFALPAFTLTFRIL